VEDKVVLLQENQVLLIQVEEEVERIMDLHQLM
jgi:hypothetical protein